MKFNFITASAFSFGLLSGISQLTYLSGIVPAMNDLNESKPAIYLITIPFFLWVILSLASLNYYGGKALWTLLPSPIALIGPVLMIYVMFFVTI